MIDMIDTAYRQAVELRQQAKSWDGRPGDLDVIMSEAADVIDNLVTEVVRMREALKAVYHDPQGGSLATPTQEAILIAIGSMSMMAVNNVA